MKKITNRTNHMSASSVSLSEFSERISLIKKINIEDSLGGYSAEWVKVKNSFYAKIDVMTEASAKVNILADEQKHEIDVKCMYKVVMKTRVSIKEMRDVMVVDWKGSKLFLTGHPIRVGQYVQFQAVELVAERKVQEILQIEQ